METRFNKRIPRRRSHRARPAFFEKLPIKYILVGLALVVVVLLMILINNPTESLLSTADIDVVRSKGMLRIGVDENVYALNVNGAGLEVDIAAALGRVIFENDESVILVPCSRNTVYRLFEDNEIDLAMFSQSGLSGSDYINSELAFFTDECVLMGYAPDASTTGMEIGVLYNSDCEAVLEQYISATDNSMVLKPYAAYYDMLVALRAGTIDAVCMSYTAAMSHLETGLVIYPVSVGVVAYRVTSEKGSETLISLVDELIYDWTSDGSMEAWIAASNIRRGT
ncbi:MAG TPA: hypothetical protein P5116_04690 [Eubacteriales bacterium]|nr:hypothetical protein [Clostridia bacterium]HRV73157.1 hypothetical protein [Eubacteriales bacterium]